ncbi:MAG TPA: LysM peptidoglycan-binding domain-containing protein [Thermoanaerobaculia bacterium]|nr:LysM peptidoglycan-binding domain-containing protein [Thermoanaerobaculia bacterium]
MKRSPFRLAAAVLALACLAGSTPADEPAPPIELRQLDGSLFPLPPQLAPNVAFWTDIFAKYDSNHVVLHDEDHPGRVFKVLDFTPLEAGLISEVEKRRRREQTVRSSMQQVAFHLKKLAAGELTDEGKRLAELFASAPNKKAELLAAAGRIRSQTGLKDVFEAALARSGRWIPSFERIFQGRGLPVELARLPFVESMFQGHARSKVAAGGMWQIMPATGRRFLRVGHEVDERFDPLLAAEAAATILTENYRMLGTWPLALTAYNHGPYGISRAVGRLGTRDIGVICASYNGKAFGFASKNFYAEFVAAATLYENRAHFFPNVALESPIEYEEFVPDKYVAVRHLASGSGHTVEQLVVLNPAVDDDVWAGRLLLPAGYRLRVPKGQAETFKTAYAALPAEHKVARQAAHEVRVRRGDTLSTIARRFGTSVAEMQRLNNLGKKSILRIGQVLRVPAPRPSAPPRTTVVAAAAAPPATVAPAPSTTLAQSAAVAPVEPLPQTVAAAGATGTKPTEHVVTAGDTLFSIAQRYGTTVRALMSANGMGKKTRIFPGQKLKLGP